MLTLLSLVLMAPAHGEDGGCADFDQQLNKAAYYAGTKKLNDAQDRLNALSNTMHCAPRLTSRQVGQYFQVKGVLLDHQGDTQGSAAAMTAARRIAPDDWITDFDARSRELFDDAPPPSDSKIEVRLKNPPGADEWINLDGLLVKGSLSVAPGLHVIQVGSTTARFGREFVAVEGKAVVVPLAPQSVEGSQFSEPLEYPNARRTPQEKKKDRLIAGAIAAGAGGLLYGSAVGTYELVYKGGDPPYTDGAQTAVNGLTVSAAGAGLVAATLLTWGAATPVRSTN